MKQIQKPLCLALFLCTSSIVANPFKDFTFHVGPTFNFASFKFGRLPKADGFLTGIHADIIHKHKHSNITTRIKFDGRWNTGHIKSGTIHNAKIKDYRPELDLGYRISFGKHSPFSLLPFTGVGFYGLSTRLSSHLIRRQFYNVYVPLGVQLIWKIKNTNLDIGLAGEYRINTWSRVKLKIPQVGSTNKLKIRHVEGLLVEMPMTWHFHTDYGVKIHTKVVPYFDWNRFGRAQSITVNNRLIRNGKVEQWYLGLHADVGMHF